MRKICVLALLLLLSACGSKLDGEYAIKNGALKLNFEQGGKFTVTNLGEIVNEGTYKISGNNLFVEGKGGTKDTFLIQKDGSIRTPKGIVFIKNDSIKSSQ